LKPKLLHVFLIVTHLKPTSRCSAAFWAAALQPTRWRNQAKRSRFSPPPETTDVREKTLKAPKISVAPAHERQFHWIAEWDCRNRQDIVMVNA
ncbi:MAG: hypothetical protein AAFR75_10675, partial [Pseudomonadota bacterium]